MAYYIILGIYLSFSFVESFTKKVSRKVFYLSLLVIIIFTGIREGVGIDYYRYLGMFESYDSVSSTRDGIGFQFLIVLFKTINMSPYQIFFMMSLISLLLIGKGIKENSKHPIFSILVYFSLYMIPFNFTAVAQGIAVGLFFYSISFMKEKRTISILVITIIATTIHLNGLIIFIAYIMYRLKINKNKAILIVALCVGLLFMSLFIENTLILKLLPEFVTSIFNNYMVRYQDTIGISSILIRLIFFGFIIFFGYSKFDDHNKGILNIYLLSFVVYAIFSESALFATRVNLFVKSVDVILLANVIYYSTIKINRVFLFFAITLMLIVVLISAFNSESVYPYKHIFNL